MTAPDAWKFAEALAGAGMLPRQYQDNPASVLWALEYGRAIGLDVITVIQSIHVIQNRATASADLMASLTRRAGHRMRITGDDQRAEVVIIRADDREFQFRAVWDWAKAERAGLVKKDTWRQFPGAMLRARAISECVRMACPEVLHGSIYTPEELGARVDADGAPVEVQAEVHRLRPAVPAADEWSTPAAAPGPAEQEIAQHAADATTRERVLELWGLARTGRMLERPVTAPDTGELVELGAYLTRRGKTLPATAEQQPAPGPDEVTDAEVLDGEPVPDDDHAAAVAELRAFAAEAGLDRIEEDAHQALGLPLADASATSIRALLAQLRGTAA
jgi:hypothetical protein